MKRFLSISFCLMLCLTSLFMFSACKEKPKEVGEVHATEVLTTAMENLETVKAMKMYSDNFMFMGPFVFIASETKSYTEVLGQKAWVEQEGDYWYEYDIATFQFDDEDPVTTYTKKLVVFEEDEGVMDEDSNPLSTILEEFENSSFYEASVLKGEYSISFKVTEDGATSKITFKVEDETLKSITISAQGLSMTLNFEFGESVLEDIPAKPTGVVWNELEPKIVVTGIETSYFVTDQQPDLENAVIKFYADKEDDEFETFEVEIEMISGFDATTPTEPGEPRTMTITFWGMTFNVEYTVSEAPAGE